ncbi:MAG: hypothetical protein ACRDOO_09205, partial [Actinomadura sp.]
QGAVTRFPVLVVGTGLTVPLDEVDRDVVPPRVRDVSITMRTSRSKTPPLVTSPEGALVERRLGDLNPGWA